MLGQKNTGTWGVNNDMATWRRVTAIVIKLIVNNTEDMNVAGNSKCCLPVCSLNLHMIE